MKIYTKTGDDGGTGLFGGGRVLKSAPRIEAYGAVDELNAFLGTAIAQGLTPALAADVAAIQHELFVVGAELATPNEARRGSGDVPTITSAQVGRLEAWIDRYEAELPPLRQFILPGGVGAAACLHVARTVCRRAERRVVALQQVEPSAVSSELLIYLNRLGDLLFVLARSANQAAGAADVPWEKP